MYSNVLAWFGLAGLPLLAIKKIKALVDQLILDVKTLDDEAQKQPAPTTGRTRSRTEVKKEAAEKAEALRGLVLELTTDDELRDALAKPVSSYLYGAEAGFLTYAQKIADAVPTLGHQDLDGAGYDATIRTVLTTDLDALTKNVGQARLLAVAGAAVTDSLPPLFDAVDAGLASLDRFVNLQRFTQQELVAQYEALRVLPKTPRHEQYRAKGETPFDVPQLLFNVLEHDVPTPTLHNTGGRGHEVVFYLGATPGSRPRAGQGVVVKNGKKITLDGYERLGDAATEPYLLVMQTSELGPGGWRVRG